MRPTLDVGQKVFVDPGAYESALPERGDIIAFRIPDYPDIIAIKRIIGLPGDAVEQSGGTVYVNGSAIDEPYVIEDTKTLGPWLVVPGHVFVMGDNRRTRTTPGTRWERFRSRMSWGEFCLIEMFREDLFPFLPAPSIRVPDGCHP